MVKRNLKLDYLATFTKNESKFSFYYFEFVAEGSPGSLFVFEIKILYFKIILIPRIKVIKEKKIPKYVSTASLFPIQSTILVSGILEWSVSKLYGVAETI